MVVLYAFPLQQLYVIALYPKLTRILSISKARQCHYFQFMPIDHTNSNSEAVVVVRMIVNINTMLFLLLNSIQLQASIICTNQ